MKAYKKEVSNSAKTKFVIITRSKLSDGYNYYLTLLSKQSSGRILINESYKQKESILSEKLAIATAKKLL
jgi:hypothetical protein